MGLSTIMLVIMGGVGVNVFSGFVKAKAAEELQYNTQFVTETIRTLVTQAENITLPTSADTSAVLSLEMADTVKNPTIIDVVDGRVRVRAGAGEAEFITGTSVSVTSVEFSNVMYEEGVGSLRVVLQLGLRNPDDRTIYYASSTVHTTINLQYP